MLRYVVANIRKQLLEAVVKDRTGRVRKIMYDWKTKDREPPPLIWYESVQGEVQFQLSEEHREGLPK